MQRYEFLRKKRYTALKNLNRQISFERVHRGEKNDLEVYLLIYHLTVQNLEGVQFRLVVQEREDCITDSGVVGQTQVFLRGTRGRSWVRMPIGEDLQVLAAGIFQGSKLIFWRKGEVLGRVVDVLHPVVLCNKSLPLFPSRRGGNSTQEIAARLIGCVLLSLGYQFFNYSMWNCHDVQ